MRDRTLDGDTTADELRTDGRRNSERSARATEDLGDKTAFTKTEDDREAGDEKKRGTWGSQLQFVLTALGLSVGLGNIWRFPAMAYENGGSAFIIPYLVCLVFFGFPMVYLEFYMGQYVRAAPPVIFRRYAPVLQGIGWGPAITSAGVCVYYTIIIGWASLYLISFNDIKQWSECRNESQFCVSRERTEYNCPNMSDVTYLAFKRDCMNNSDHFLRDNMITAPEDYYQNDIMGVSGDLLTLGSFNYRMAITHTLLWLLIWLILVKGVVIMGYLSYIIVTLPYLIITVMFIYGLTLPGSERGLKFYWGNADFSKLWKSQTWTMALNQLCFSLSIGSGGLIVLASYCKKDNNCFRNAIILCVGDTIMSVIGGGAMFATLGYLANELQADDFATVVTRGEALAFVSIPQAMSGMPVPWLWSTLFFLMIILLGISSEVALMEVICSSIYDMFPTTRNKKWLVSGLVCLLIFVLGLSMMFGNGLYVFIFLNAYISSSGRVAYAGLQAIMIAYVYGFKNAHKDVQTMFKKPRSAISKYFGPTAWCWQLNWLTISPALAAIICALIVIAPAPKYGKGDDVKEFPNYMVVLGWLLALSPLLLIIPYAITNIAKTLKSGKPLLDAFRVQPDHPSYNRINGIKPAAAEQTCDENLTKETNDCTQEAPTPKKDTVDNRAPIDDQTTFEVENAVATNEE